MKILTELCVHSSLKIERQILWHTFRDSGEYLTTFDVRPIPFRDLPFFHHKYVMSVFKLYKGLYLFLYLVPERRYRLFRQKRLDDVIRNVTGVPLKLKCTTLCSTTNGCHARNIMRNYGNTCQLTTGLRNETEMINDGNTNLYDRGMNVLAI